jgi:2-methylcitrate dehydratase PrpD
VSPHRATESNAAMKAAAVSPLMNKVAGYIAGAAQRNLPARVQEKTKHHLLDTLAAIVSGSRLYPGQKAIEYIESQGGTPEALVIGTRILTSAVNAALANGMCAHADETDDSHAA